MLFTMVNVFGINEGTILQIQKWNTLTFNVTGTSSFFFVLNKRFDICCRNRDVLEIKKQKAGKKMFPQGCPQIPLSSKMENLIPLA